VTDLFAVRTFRRDFAVEHLKILIPAGLVGICIAAVLMGQLDQDIIRVLIGIMVVLFCLDHWLRPDISNTRMAGRWGGYLWGMVSGFTSTQIHAGAAPVSIYLLPQRMDKVKLMGTLAIFFTAINYVKLVPYTLLGALNAENFMTSLLLMPLAPIGVKLGRVLLDKINQRILYRYLYIALFLSGLKLCYDGVL